MPVSLSPPQIDEVDFHSEPLKLAGSDVSTAYALTLVNETFNQYESWRNQNHDWRWKVHDQLYFSLVPMKVWEGTNIARSNLALPYTFQQVETAMPQIMEALFGFDDWFSVTPEPGGGLAEARAIQAHLKYNLEHAKNDFGQTAETELETSVRQALIYGNGGVMLEWDPIMDRVLVMSVDLRDIYIDPATPSGNIDESRSVIYRRLMTVDEVDKLRNDKRMDIPPREMLVYMSENRRGVLADSSKRNQEAARKIQYSPGTSDWLPNPADKLIEVLVYYDRGRIIWNLNRQWIAFNSFNPFGFVPFCVAPCWSVPFRFYGQSFADQLEGPQQYGQALLNAHVDELTLALFPPRFVKRSGGAMNPSRARWRPGLTIETQGDPAKEIVTQYPQQATKDALETIAIVRQIAEDATGVNSMASGVPRPGNVNRTATGVQSQLNGATNRMQLIVKHFEDYLIGPMLYKMYRMIQLNAKEGADLPALGPNDQFFSVGSEAFKSPIRFRMNASSRMMNKEKLQQALPVIEQALFQPQVMGNLNQLGYTVDPLEFMIMLQDATGTTRAYNIVRPLTPEEEQARQQPPPQAQLEMQQSQAELQLRRELGQMKQQSEMAKVQAQHDWETGDTSEKSATEILKLITSDKATMLSQNPQQKAQELEMKKQEGQMKLQHQSQKHQLDMAATVAKHRMGMQANAQKAAQDSQIAQLEMGTQRQQAGQDMALQNAQGTNDLEMQNQSHLMTLAHGQQKHKQQMKQMETKNAIMGKKKTNNKP